MTPVEVVQRQVDAYNARDLARFVGNYSETVTVVRMPALEPAIKGKTQFAEFYATQRFNLPDLHAEVVNRIVLGNKVFDHERISGAGEAPFEIIVAYEVAGDVIERVWTFAPE
ncbi:MAG: nuclear transport factor 2 family protein [Betaproteobacteria bacterium]